MRGATPAAVLLGAALAGCAGPSAMAVPSPAAAGSRCDEAWRRVESLLSAGLETYLDGMRRFSLASDPARSTAEAEARAHERARAWSAVHGPGFAAGCPEWTPALVACVIAAESSPGLVDCGLEPLVRSFTDEVVGAYLAPEP